MFRELEEHLRFATNGGNIQITMTVFRPKQPKERWGTARLEFPTDSLCRL
jgi:nitric-oxide synthase